VRLAFIKHKFVSFGGGEGYLHELLSAAVAQGHEVQLITRSWPEQTRPIPYHVHRLAPRGWTSATRYRAFARQAVPVGRALGAERVVTLDRVEGADVWRAGEGVHPVWLERRRSFEPGWRAGLNAHSPRQRLFVDLEARCAASARLIIANSHLVQADLRRLYPDVSARVEVVHNGIDLERFTPPGRPANRQRLRAEHGLAPEAPLLLFVGSGYRRKGLLEMLRALTALPDAQLWVLGRDDPRPWQRRAASLGVANRTTFHPPTPDLTPLYHAADALVFPTWFESFGFVGLEAMACGTPVVTSAFAGMAELVRPSSGRVIDRPSDTGALVSAVQDLLATAPEPAGVAEAAAGYSLRRNVERTVALIEEMGPPG